MERTERIERLSDTKNTSSSEKKFSVPYKGIIIDMPIYRIDIKVPIYRIENGRTKVPQSQYVDKNELDPDFFSDVESEHVQDAQEKILLELVEKKPLMEDLIETGRQEEPLILTHDGVVLNGNRRLAAMRKLKWTHVDCVILPKDTDQVELLRIELSLQMQRETKEEYDWVSELLTIQHGIEMGMEATDIAKQMKVKKTVITTKRQTMGLVNEYLNYIREPGQYHLVGDAEQAFKDITKHQKKINNYREEILNDIFAIINIDKSKIGGRKYNMIMPILKDPEGYIEAKIVKKAAKGNNNELKDVEEENKDDIFRETPQAKSARKERAQISVPQGEKDVKDIEEIIKVMKNSSDVEKEKMANINNLYQAQNALATVKIDSDYNLDQIEKKITSIEKEVMRIISEARDVRGKTNAPR